MEEKKEENKPLLNRLLPFLDGKKEDKSAERPKATETKPEAKPEAKPKATTAREAPPTRKTWGSMATLEDHFVRHGKDFNSKSADEYAAQAWQFLQRAIDEGLPVKQDPDGVLRVWEPRTRTFASYNRDLTTKTFFRPNRQDYFDDQPGKNVKLTRKQP
jgi:pyocin large subunit-like protein